MADLRPHGPEPGPGPDPGPGPGSEHYDFLGSGPKSANYTTTTTTTTTTTGFFGYFWAYNSTFELITGLCHYSSWIRLLFYADSCRRFVFSLIRNPFCDRFLLQRAALPHLLMALSLVLALVRNIIFFSKVQVLVLNQPISRRTNKSTT